MVTTFLEESVPQVPAGCTEWAFKEVTPDQVARGTDTLSRYHPPRVKGNSQLMREQVDKFVGFVGFFLTFITSQKVF